MQNLFAPPFLCIQGMFTSCAVNLIGKHITKKALSECNASWQPELNLPDKSALSFLDSSTTSFIPFIYFLSLCNGRSQDEHHTIKHVHQMHPGHQCDRCGFPLSVQHPFLSGLGLKFLGCLDLLWHPQHFYVCCLSEKCGERHMILHS